MAIADWLSSMRVVGPSGSSPSSVMSLLSPELHWRGLCTQPLLWIEQHFPAFDFSMILVPQLSGTGR